MLVGLVQLAVAKPVVASGAGFVVGAVINYCLNYAYTFRSSKRHHEAIVKFFVVAAAGLGLNSLIMISAVDTMALHFLLAQVIATGVVLVWNFLGNLMWTFDKTSYER